MTNVTSILANGISVGLLAGVVSGLFYLFIAGIRWAGFRDVVLREVHRSTVTSSRCAQCQSSESSVLVTRCTRCDSRGCLECTKNRLDTWVCPECSDKFSEVKQQSEVWFSNQLQRRFNKTVTTSTSLVQTKEDGSKMDRTTVQVREFIEKLVEKLVSGGLDEVTVNRMYDHPEYDRMFSRYHALLCKILAQLAYSLHMAFANEPLSEEESPSSTHVYLKQLIECIIREAMELPNMKKAIHKNIKNGSVSSDNIDVKTYEDILATAILNKVIDKFQQFRIDKSSNLDGNSNFLHDLRRGRPNYISCLEVGLNDSGSIEDVTVGDEGSWDGSASTEPLSLRIEEHIEEIMTYTNDRDESPNPHNVNSELDFYFSKMNFLPNHRVPFPELGMDIVDGPEIEDEDDVDGDDNSSEESKVLPQPTDLLNSVDSWEQNWLFQKRRLKISPSVQSVPVPMLVPNPNEDYRAQIGDRDADEMSDLSECSEGAPADMSDFDSSDEDLKNDNLKPLNKSFILAETKDISESYSEFPRSDTPDGGYGGSAEEYASTHDGGSELAEATNSELFKATSVDCLSEFGQQDSEYTEDYASVTQRQLNSLLQLRDCETIKPVPKPRSVVSSAHGESEERAAETIKLSKTSQSEIAETIENVLATPPRPGTIAEREHKKWESAIPLPNNPYSPENINKRLQKRQYLSRSCSEASLELPESLPEVPKIKVTSQPLKVVCASSELDTKRYGRDYYVNVDNSTLPSTGLQPPPSAKKPSLTGTSKQKAEPNQVEIVRLKNTPTKTAQTTTISNETEVHTDLVRLRSAPASTTSTSNEKDSPQNLHHVEAEVARLQQEIKRNEERWYKELHSPKLESVDHKTVINTTKSVTKDVQCTVIAKVNGNSTDTAQTTSDSVKTELHVKGNSESVTNNSNLCEKNKSVDFVNDENNCIKQPLKHLSHSCDNLKNSAKQGKPPISTRQKVSNSSKQPTIAMDRMRTAYGYYEVFSNGNTDKKWDARSDGSTISSDSEFSPSLPSVKELAKHFTGGTESDSSTTSKGSCSSPNLKGPDVCLATKDVVIITKKDMEKLEEKSTSRPGKQVRQIHSLTARSMSREFREGLRKNLPIQMDKNLYSAVGSDSSVRRSLSPQFPNVTYDSTPGYTSDESDTMSPVPPSKKLQDNIEFWEKMKRSK